MVNFELTREYIDHLQELISAKDENTITSLLSDLHPADIAEIYEELSIEEAKFLYFLMDDDKAADVLTELEEDDRRRFLDSLPSEVIAKRFIDNMDSDDAADIIGEMDNDRQQEVLSHIDDVNTAGDIADLLNYDENSAGGLMAKELIKVKENWNIPTCLRSMRRQAEEVDEIYYVYVVDNDGILKGTLSLKRMLLSPVDSIVKEIYNSDVKSVKVDVEAEEVSYIMDKYDLVALPVIDSIGRLVGRITIDDVVDVIREQETVAELSSKYEIHRSLLTKWKREAIEGLPGILSTTKKKENDDQKLIEVLYRKIGQLEVENDWLKKKVDTINL